MKLLGLNSPEIFIILVIFLSILGPKRIEKGFLLFNKILKFLLSNEEDQTLENIELNNKRKLNEKEQQESLVKDEPIEAEAELEESEKSEVKDEPIEAEAELGDPEKNKVKDEPIEAEAELEAPEKNKVKD